MRPADTFDLRKFLTEGQLKRNLQEVDEKEKAVVDDIKDEMSDILKGLDTELSKASKTTNEGLITIASIAIALPAIMGLVAKFGKAAGNIINKIIGKKPTAKEEEEGKNEINEQTN